MEQGFVMEREKLQPKPKMKPRKRLLTDEWLRQLKPQAKLFRVWDTRQHGLCIEVHPGAASRSKRATARKSTTRSHGTILGNFPGSAFVKPARPPRP